AMRLLMVANAQLDRLINNKDYRERLVSPSRKEFVFGQKQQKVEELKKLKAEVADLLYHIKAELADDGQTLKDKLPYS
ncbi:MAG: hypothetical protein KI790_16415, partial [Cyclobacteriaceae bacterium]|nr:hypothetical protein [Cyclobacteriaceae bacterium HetDA_MAG_MS6]